MNVGVLVSGSGTNLQALLDAEISPAKISLVLCNRPGAAALARAEMAGVPSKVIDHKSFSTRHEFETAMLTALSGEQIDLVVLAGFMRILTSHFVSAFPNKIVNTHPALCPAFPGIHAAKQALDHGAKITGCTVHFVDTGVDTGPIIAQATVPIKDDDTEQSLQKRIQTEEHKLLPEVVRAISRGQIKVTGSKVSWSR